MGKYRVESQIKEMYIDLMNTRANAMSRTRVHFLIFPMLLLIQYMMMIATALLRCRMETGRFNQGTGVTADKQLSAIS